MKHKWSVTVLLLSMFLLTQFVGLFVVSSYDFSGSDLPYGLDTPDDEAAPSLVSLIFAFVVAFALVFFLMKFRWRFVIKAWFFFVITLSLSLSFNAFFTGRVPSHESVALLCGVLFASWKIFRPNKWVHNGTELLVYPGIASVFVPLLSPLSIILLLVLISFYDMWAVWHSGTMQKMAQFQMEELNIFGGFLLPSVSPKVRARLRELRRRYGRNIPDKLSTRRFKVNLAILGGGDVIFPIITAGVFLKSFGFIPALFVIFGSFFGLLYLFLRSSKGESYPAMPYITIGIFLSLVAYLLLW